MEDMAEDRKQWRRLISCPNQGVKLGTINEDDDYDQSDLIFACYAQHII